MPVCPTCGARYEATTRFCGLDGAALIDPPSGRTDHFTGLTIGTRETSPGAEPHEKGYVLRVRMGGGAFGSVYAASRNGHVGEFAVKVLRGGMRASEEQVARFRREVRILAEIRHPHLIDIHAFGHDVQVGYFVVMPRLRGEDLAARVHRVGPLPLPEVDTILRQVAQALGKVHAAGVVHRDVKPENIFLETLAKPAALQDDVTTTAGIHARLLDFGLAKLMKGRATRIADSLEVKTGPTQVLGTPATMSPEQVLSQEVDLRSDLYSLGVVLYEMLTGRLPFDAESAVLLMRMHVFDAPPLPSARVRWLPTEIDAIVADLLAKRPSQRIESTEVLLQRWRAAVPAALLAYQSHEMHGATTL